MSDPTPDPRLATCWHHVQYRMPCLAYDDEPRCGAPATHSAGYASDEMRVGVCAAHAQLYLAAPARECRPLETAETLGFYGSQNVSVSTKEWWAAEAERLQATFDKAAREMKTRQPAPASAPAPTCESNGWHPGHRYGRCGEPAIGIWSRPEKDMPLCATCRDAIERWYRISKAWRTLQPSTGAASASKKPPAPPPLVPRDGCPPDDPRPGFADGDLHAEQAPLRVKRGEIQRAIAELDREGERLTDQIDRIQRILVTRARWRRGEA